MASGDKGNGWGMGRKGKGGGGGEGCSCDGGPRTLRGGEGMGRGKEYM